MRKSRLSLFKSTSMLISVVGIIMIVATIIVVAYVSFSVVNESITDQISSGNQYDDLAKLNNGEYVKEVNVKRSLFKMHGFVHAREAAENYVKFFPELEDKKITNSIKRHMFPLNIRLPKYKESWIVTISDKIDSILDIPIILFYLIKKG